VTMSLPVVLAWIQHCQEGFNKCLGHEHKNVCVCCS